MHWRILPAAFDEPGDDWRFNVQCCPTSSQKEYVPIELQLLETKNPEAQTTPEKSSPHNSDFSQLWCGRAFLCTPPTFRTSRQAPPTNPTASRQPTASVKMKLNISYPANGSQKLVEIEDERKLRDFMEKRVRCCCSPSNFFPDHLGTLFPKSSASTANLPCRLPVSQPEIQSKSNTAIQWPECFRDTSFAAEAFARGGANQEMGQFPEKHRLIRISTWQRRRAAGTSNGRILAVVLRLQTIRDQQY